MAEDFWAYSQYLTPQGCHSTLLTMNAYELLCLRVKSLKIGHFQLISLFVGLLSGTEYKFSCRNNITNDDFAPMLAHESLQNPNVPKILN